MYYRLPYATDLECSILPGSPGLPHLPPQLAVLGDGAAVEFVVAGGEVGRVDDQHLTSRAGQGQLRTVTSWQHWTNTNTLLVKCLLISGSSNLVEFINLPLDSAVKEREEAE